MALQYYVSIPVIRAVDGKVLRTIRLSMDEVFNTVGGNCINIDRDIPGYMVVDD